MTFLIQVKNTGTQILSVGIQTVEQLFLEWEWSPEGRDWLSVQVQRQNSISFWSGSGAQRGGTGWLFRYTGRRATLPGVGVESRGKGLAGCSGTLIEVQLFLEWEWSPEGRDWLAVQVHR
jgi:hypothetical protein